jgi:hypothetical protein
VRSAALPSDPAAATALRSLLGESEQGTSADQIAWAFRKLLVVPSTDEGIPLWQGFCLFSREDVGAEPEVLARSFMPPLADMQAAIADVQADEEDVRECHEALAALWEQRLDLYGASVGIS